MLYHSPVGLIKVKVSDGFVNELLYINEAQPASSAKEKLSAADKKVLQNCIIQFDEYF